MKIIIYITAFFLTFTSITFSQSLMDYQAGTSIENQTGADICADDYNFIGTYSGEGTLCGNATQELCVKLCLQGCGTGEGEEVQISIRRDIAPHTILQTQTGVLNNVGQVCLNFDVNNFIPGKNYYFTVKHRNSIRTWSQIITAPLTPQPYDFTQAINKAYGNNLILVNEDYCIYTGDINQDGVLDVTDYAAIDNDVYIFLTGHVLTDLNCDGAVDLDDFALFDNNVLNYVKEEAPPPPGPVDSEPGKVSPDLPNNNLNDINSEEPAVDDYSNDKENK